MIAYIKRFFSEIKTKLTTYLALLTASVAELPNVVSQDSLNAFHSVVSDSTHKHIVAGLAAVTIWSRVRRNLKPPPPPPSVT